MGVRTEMVWNEYDRCFNEIEVNDSYKTDEWYERRRKQMAEMIVNYSMTIRQIGDAFGIHHTNVYRALAGRIGGIYSDVESVWRANKQDSLERANTTKKLRSELKTIPTNT